MHAPSFAISTHLMHPSPDAQIRIHDGVAYVTTVVGSVQSLCLSGDPTELAATLRSWAFHIELAAVRLEVAA